MGDLVVRRISSDSVALVSAVCISLSLQPVSSVIVIRDFMRPRLPLLGGVLHLTDVPVLVVCIIKDRRIRTRSSSIFAPSIPWQLHAPFVYFAFDFDTLVSLWPLSLRNLYLFWWVGSAFAS